MKKARADASPPLTGLNGAEGGLSHTSKQADETTAGHADDRARMDRDPSTHSSEPASQATETAVQPSDPSGVAPQPSAQNTDTSFESSDSSPQHPEPAAQITETHAEASESFVQVIETPLQTAHSIAEPAEPSIQATETPVQPALSTVKPAESSIQATETPVQPAPSTAKPAEVHLQPTQPGTRADQQVSSPTLDPPHQDGRAVAELPAGAADDGEPATDLKPEPKQAAIVLTGQPGTDPLSEGVQTCAALIIRNVAQKGSHSTLLIPYIETLMEVAGAKHRYSKYIALALTYM